MASMTPDNLIVLDAELKRDEGEVLHVYDDANDKPIVKGSVVAGVPTGSIGVNLTFLFPEESAFLYRSRRDRAIAALLADHPWVGGIDAVRQRVLANMAYNLGEAHLDTFHDVLAYAKEGRYGLAAAAMESSLWYREVGARAVRLVAMMQNGAVA
jgi:lysozyme